MEQQINETIRHERLLKIQITEEKLGKFTNAYQNIKEHLVVKLTKDFASFVIRLPLGLIIIGLLASFAATFFPEFITNLTITEDLDQGILNDILSLFQFVLPPIMVVLFIMLSLIKANHRRRASLFMVSKLLTEIMDYLSESSEEEKRRYVHFVDTLADMEQASAKGNPKNQASTTT